MIKPASYWALHMTCDPLTLGRVGATLGGQSVEPPLNAAEQALVNLVRQDSEWMDERIEAKRKRWATKARASRAISGAEQNAETTGDNGRQAETTGDNGRQAETMGDNGRQAETTGDDGRQAETMGDNGRQRETMAASPDVSPRLGVSDTIHPSIHPSIHPTLEDTNVSSASALTHARGVPIETLETLCRNRGIPVSYAVTFAEAMVTQGWEVKTTLPNGTVVPTRVTAMNAGMILGTWYRREKPGCREDEVTLRQGRRRSRFSEGGGGEAHG